MPKKTEKEKVFHPSHYGGDTIYEVIKVAEVLGFVDNAYLFNTFKYIARAGKKDESTYIEDLEKALFYLTREIENQKKPPDWENEFSMRSS